MRVLAILICLWPALGMAETLVAARTLRSQAILGPADVAVIADTIPGALSHPSEAVGLETRVILYAGRPIRPGDVGPPAMIERNEIVTLRYARGPLSIVTEARALGRAGLGDKLRVMNLSSRSTVSGTVTATGEVVVGGAHSGERP